jgi:ADP-ribosylglycohydrolase
MPYFPHLERQFWQLRDWLDVRKEQGANVKPIEKEIAKTFTRLSRQLEKMRLPAKADKDEPLTLKAIRAVRPRLRRKLSFTLSDVEHYDKMLGAWFGRAAGLTLGEPVEGFSKQEMQHFAKVCEQPYPLQEYWKIGRSPSDDVVYGAETRIAFLKDHIDHIGPDDDLAYTILGLLILEEAGIDFTTADVGRLWVKYLPIACTAEDVALRNLKKGIKPPKTATTGNPYFEWIGADIRSDPWGYAAPGLPEVAAEFAYRDASLSHIKNGVYGAMFFAAAISAAFVLNDPEEIIRVGLQEIPERCRLANMIRQTIEWCRTNSSWEDTYNRIAKATNGMHWVHTINNAAITVAGILHAKGDFEKTIGYTVSMGWDCDCTGATSGSLIGAMLGYHNLPKKWIAPLGDGVATYLKGAEHQSSTDLARRFVRVTRQVLAKFGR